MSLFYTEYSLPHIIYFCIDIIKLLVCEVKDCIVFFTDKFVLLSAIINNVMYHFVGCPGILPAESEENWEAQLLGQANH